MTDTTTATIDETILSMLGQRGPGKTICPSEVARAIAGSDEKAWRRLMAPIRTVAVRLADDGRITLRRKGRIIDPHDFKGIYRIALTDERAGDEGVDDGKGNSASVRPVAR